MSKQDFENELDLLLSLSSYIMEPIQQQYINMDKYIDTLRLQNLYDKKAINDYYNQIYALLVKDKVVSTKWKHEYQMFELIISVYQDARYQYYADWVSPQNYDVYVPSIKTAFEFQGLQHYEAVDFWGGTSGFSKRQELDERKRLLSAQNGIKLVEWKYDEPITLKTLNQKLE